MGIYAPRDNNPSCSLFVRFFRGYLPASAQLAAEPDTGAIAGKVVDATDRVVLEVQVPGATFSLLVTSD
jgi:hypothetical protein